MFNLWCSKVHLVTCSAFLSSANKFEFLDMGYVSMASFGWDELSILYSETARPASESLLCGSFLGKNKVISWTELSMEAVCYVWVRWEGSLSHIQLLLLTQQLMERLKRIVKLPHRLRPVQSSKVSMKSPHTALWESPKCNLLQWTDLLFHLSPVHFHLFHSYASKAQIQFYLSKIQRTLHKVLNASQLRQNSH